MLVRKQPARWEGIRMHQYRRASHPRAAVRWRRLLHRHLLPVQLDRLADTQWCALQSGGDEAQALAKAEDREPAYPSLHSAVE